MDPSPQGKLPIIESNIDQLLQELHQLASRVKRTDQSDSTDNSAAGSGQYLVASGRS